jgi:hypothetical protein
VQYVEGLNGETARRSRVSARAAEAFMNNAGQVAISLACICLQGAVKVFISVYHEPSGDMLVRGVGCPSSFTPFPYRIVAFTLSSLVSWL